MDTAHDREVSKFKKALKKARAPPPLPAAALHTGLDGRPAQPGALAPSTRVHTNERAPCLRRLRRRRHDSALPHGLNFCSIPASGPSFTLHPRPCAAAQVDPRRDARRRQGGGRGQAQDDGSRGGGPCHTRRRRPGPARPGPCPLAAFPWPLARGCLFRECRARTPRAGVAALRTRSKSDTHARLPLRCVRVILLKQLQAEEAPAKEKEQPAAAKDE